VPYAALMEAGAVFILQLLGTYLATKRLAPIYTAVISSFISTALVTAGKS